MGAQQERDGAGGRHGIRVTALIPAHNEAETIALAIASLQQGVRPPDRILVIADNCTDDTADLARRSGAEVYETVDNTDKKAGGLNQALAMLLPEATEDDAFLVTDADTFLVPEFVDTAARVLAEHPDYAAVGGLFFGEPGGGLIGQLQRNEFFRFQRETLLKGGMVMVLSGTASLFRAPALKAVADARGTVLPGRRGQVYDTMAMTEDNELTLAMKTLGFGMTSPDACRNVTEVMTGWGDLWRQRERWMRGALENLRNYGWTPTTRKYWGQQIGITYGVLAITALLVLLALALLSIQTWEVGPFWLLITLLFVLERVATVWKLGWSARLVALPLVVELCYNVFIQAVFVKAAWDSLRRKEAGWNYVPRSS